MSLSAVFTRFPELPAEIRLHIWGLVPQPSRVVGILPCESGGQTPRDPLQTESRYLQPSHFRQISQPRDLPVFAPLHTCRESSAVWLQRLIRLPQYLEWPSSSGDSSNIYARFEMPYVSPDADIFTVFGLWKVRFASGCSGYPLTCDDDGTVDPFCGFDRSRIQHVGLVEMPFGLEGSIQSIGVQDLPCLKSFSFLSLGPDVLATDDAATHLQEEMPVVNVRVYDCELSNLARSTVAAHPYFINSRPRHAHGLSPAIRELPRFVEYVKALLWHACFRSWDVDLEDVTMLETLWDFIEYVFNSGDDTWCPLPFAACGVDGHSRAEVVTWEPEFQVYHKILHKKGFSGALKGMGVLS